MKLVGSITLTCGCKHTDDMGDIDDLLWTREEEICTRDPDEPFVMAEVTGVYCRPCRARLEEIAAQIEAEQATA